MTKVYSLVNEKKGGEGGDAPDMLDRLQQISSAPYAAPNAFARGADYYDSLKQRAANNLTNFGQNIGRAYDAYRGNPVTEAVGMADTYTATCENVNANNAVSPYWLQVETGIASPIFWILAFQIVFFVSYKTAYPTRSDFENDVVHNSSGTSGNWKFGLIMSANILFWMLLMFTPKYYSFQPSFMGMFRNRCSRWYNWIIVTIISMITALSGFIMYILAIYV